MKKRCICLLAALVLLLGLCVSAMAYDSYYVIDTAQLLSDSEGSEIDAICQDAESTYGCGIYVVTVDDYTQYYGAGSIEEFSEAVFEELGLGVGEEQNGILLALSMAERDFDLCAHGTIGNRAFTDYGKQCLQEQFLDNFRDDDWYGGLYDFADYSRQMLQMDADGTPLDVSFDQTEASAGAPWPRVAIVVFVPLLVALIVCLIMKGQMKTARKKTEADAYIPKDGVKMTRQDDIYLTTTQTRVKIETENKSGGTSVNSGGYSHSSGKF